ncbi:hypothetical protein [Kitasatospora camelliae]|uniref:Uncharacterized protein n=1 Tax=Kitasatospora camelliae TaxID=3156397 RepID=A0AAU8JS99_9ACTN
MAYGGDVVATSGPGKVSGGGRVATGVLLLVYFALCAVAVVISLTEGNYDGMIDMAHRNATLPWLAVAGYFTPLVLTLVSTAVLAVLAFRGVRWVAPAAAVLLLVTTCSASGQQLFFLLNSRVEGIFDLPFDRMFSVLHPFLGMAVAVALTVVAAVARAPRAAPGAGGPFAPPPFSPPPAAPPAPPAPPTDRPSPAP